MLVENERRNVYALKQGGRVLSYGNAVTSIC